MVTGNIRRLEVLNMVDEINGESTKIQIVILGGGFAGVETARYLDRTAAKCADEESVRRFNAMLVPTINSEILAVHDLWGCMPDERVKIRIGKSESKTSSVFRL
jgi:thioredoxin reductase